MATLSLRAASGWFRLIVVGLVAMGAMLLVGQSALADSEPTCSDELGIDVHGRHIIGDYVTGVGRDALIWPPAGQVGGAIGGEGVALAGGPGPGFHFPKGIAPGASFCNPQSQSPGFHVP